MHKTCYQQPISHITVCPHSELLGTVVLGVVVGLPVLIVVTAIVVWIRYRNG